MQRKQMRIIGDHEYAVAEHRHSAINPAGGIAGETLAARPAVVPDLAPASRIERVDFVDGGGVHYSVHDKGRNLERPRRSRNRERPLLHEARNVAGVDLVERAVTVAGFVPVVGGPGAGLGVRHIGEGDSGPQFRIPGCRLPDRIPARAVEVGYQVPHFIRSRLDLRHERFLADHFRYCVLQE